MQYFPIFLDMAHTRVVVAGGDQTALAKLRLLIKSQADVHVFADAPIADVQAMADTGTITLHHRAATAPDVQNARLCYGADEDNSHNQALQGFANAAGALFNWVDRPASSDFITPAIVDRDPVVVAIGTEGAAPVVARAIKRDLEGKLPVHLGTLAALAKPLRHFADAIKPGRGRRAFWEDFFFNTGPRALQDGPLAAERVLERQAQAFATTPSAKGHICVADGGIWDADMLPHKSRMALHEADVVIFPADAPKALRELARREALVLTDTQADIDTAVSAASKGEHVVWFIDATAQRHRQVMQILKPTRLQGITQSFIPGIRPSAAAPFGRGSLTWRNSPPP